NAFLRQHLGARPAEPLGRTADDRHLVVQLEVHTVSFCSRFMDGVIGANVRLVNARRRARSRSRHSMFFAGGTWPENTGGATNTAGSYFQNWLTSRYVSITTFMSRPSRRSTRRM